MTLSMNILSSVIRNWERPAADLQIMVMHVGIISVCVKVGVLRLIKESYVYIYGWCFVGQFWGGVLRLWVEFHTDMCCAYIA